MPKRGPIRTAIPVVRQAFEIMDATGLPFNKIPVNTNRDNLARWRRGVSSPDIFTFMQVVESMGYELVLQRRAGAPTLRTQQPAAGTSRRAGTVPATTGPTGG